MFNFLLENREFDVHVTVHRVKFLIIKPTRCTNFSNLFLEWNSACFGQFLCPSSGVFHCTHSNGICHTGYADCLWVGANAPAHKLSANLYDIYRCCVQWKTPDDGQRNCPKHVESHSKNKFEKLVHLVGFVISKWWISGWLSYCGIPWYEAVLFGLWVQAFRLNKLLPYSDETEGGNTSTFLRNVSIYLHLPDYTTSWTFVAVTAHL